MTAAQLPLYRHGSSKRQRTIALAALAASAFLYGVFAALTFPYLAIQQSAPLLILGLFVLWAMPDRASARRPRITIAVFYGLLVTVSLWPIYLSIDLPGLPWISLRRLFGAILTILILSQIFTLKEQRRALCNALASAKWPAIFLIAFAVIQLFASLTGSPWGNAMNSMMNDAFLWWGVLIASIILFMEPTVTSRWTNIFMSCALISSALCLAEVWNGEILWVNWLKHLPKFFAIDSKDIEGLLYYNPWGYYRAKGVFTNSLSFSEFLAVGSCFLSIRLFDASSNREFFFYLAINIIAVLAIIYNGSRLGVVGAAAGYAASGILITYRRWRERPGNLVSATAFYSIPLVLVISVAAFAASGRVQKLFLGSGNQILSTDARWEQLSRMPGVLLHRPILGYGPRNGAAALDYHQPGGLLTVDSYIISLLLDYGILGFIAFTGMLISAIYLAVQMSLKQENKQFRTSVALASALFCFLIIRLVLSQEDNHSLFFMLLGLFFAEAYRVRVQTVRPKLSVPNTSDSPGL